jgi:hypothetical protein
MLAKPSYLDVSPSNGEVLPFVEKLHDDSEIDAVVVRGALDRLSTENKNQLMIGVVEGSGGRLVGAELGSKLLGLLVPDLAEVKAFIKEASATAIFDYEVEKEEDVLARDDIRTVGQGTYSHIDLPIGMYARDGREDLRVVNTFSIGTGKGSALFLAKRLGSYYNPDDVLHEFLMDYLRTELVEVIEESNIIYEEGWAIKQHPGDIVVFPQFDRPAVHQVVADADRSAFLYSTYAHTRYAAYNSSPAGKTNPYLPGKGIVR